MSAPTTGRLGSGSDLSPAPQRESNSHNEKAPDDAGALLFDRQTGSVPDARTGPVEAVDQRGGDRLVPAVGADAVADRSVAYVEQFVLGLSIVERRAVLGLHEPAGRRDAEEVQAILDAAA